MQSFKLVSDVQTTNRRAFTLAGELANPDAVNPLVMGEFLELDSNYNTVRGVGNAAVPSFAVFTEQGRTDVQASGKASVLFMHAYEADTEIFDTTGLTVGAALMVADVSINSITKRGLKLAVAANHVVGHVTRLPIDNGGYLRFTRV